MKINFVDSIVINFDELREFLEKGEMKICYIRGIIVGCVGVGKIILFMRFQDMLWKDMININIIEIVDVYVNSFEVLRKKMIIRGKMLKLLKKKLLLSWK